MQNWSEIFDKASLPNTNLVYIAIGSAMGHYQENELQNNQQYPCFLEKFADNKLIILIDPMLESPLKIEEFFARQNDPLIMTKSIVENDKYVWRIFQNRTTCVVAINSCFYYEIRNYYNPQEEKEINSTVDTNVSNLINLISICLSKVNKTKIIFQDYSGPDTFNFYSSLLSCFDRDELLNNVLFDVTENESGCFIEMSPELATIDSDGNFVQERFKKLVQIRSSPKYQLFLNNRVTVMQYPMSFVITKLHESIDFNMSEVHGLYKVKQLATLYDISYDSDCVNPHYILDTYTKIFKLVLRDIIDSNGYCHSQYDYIMSIIDQRMMLYNALSVLRATE